MCLSLPEIKLRMNCGPHEYNTMSLLSFGTPEIAVKAMFHKGADYFHLQTLLMFFPTYWFLSCITYGISVPSGLFVPALLCGATWGRILFLLLAKLFGNENVSDPNVYALVGAAAGLGGTVRMTLSLCVIILEATGNLTLGKSTFTFNRLQITPRLSDLLASIGEKAFFHRRSFLGF